MTSTCRSRMVASVRRCGLVWLAAAILLPTPSGAQGLNGALIGTVKDEEGGVLEGALVRVSSPALIGGELTTPTNERGQLRFPVLPPGMYTLAIELAPAFAGYREENINIGAGATLERTAVLKLAGLVDSVVVNAAGSTIEARGSGFETRFGPEYLRTIPTRRFSMFDFIRTAPGVSPTSPASGTVNSVSVFGSGVNENSFLIDGTNFTCPCSGLSRAEPSVDVIQEVHVQSIGASVEFGNIQGGVFNVITKQGGSRFQYDASFYAQAAGLTSQPVVRPVRAGTQPSSGYERDRYNDFTTNLGGPVVRDRLWFFGGYQYLRDYDSQPGADPAFPRTYEQDKIFGKLTWRLTPSLQLMQSFHDEFWVNPTPPSLVTPFEATNRQNASVPSMTFAHLTHTLSSNTVWDVRVGRYVLAMNNDPSTGNRTIPNRSDEITGVSSGNALQIGGLDLNRVTAKAVLNHYTSRFGGDHALRVGTQIERGEHEGVAVIPGGGRYVDSNGQPFQALYREPSIDGGRFNTFALFASDSLTLKDRVTVNVGLRFDHSRAISQDVPALDAEGRETDGTIAGLGTLYTWNILSPRLGVTTRLTADGKTMLRASYGRFSQGVLTGELGPIHPGVTPTTTMAYQASTGGYTQLVSVVDPRINLALDPGTRAPRTDEYSVGVDREISRRLSMATAYIRKSGGNFIAWTDTGGQYREETRTLADGRSLPVFVLTNSTADRRFLLTNPDDYSLTYNGIVIAMEKRSADRWQAFGSYTFSRTSGLLASSAATADGAQSSTVAPNNTFGRDPNNLTNAGGRLPNDRPHTFRAMGNVEVPKVGVVVAGKLQHFSGKPWAATAQVGLPQGSQRILLEQRGTRRLPSQTLLDLRVSKRLRLGQRGRVEVLLDALNVLNDTAAEAVATDNLFSPTFGLSTLFMDPRRAMIGLRLNLGQ